jgi:hypothetical protein
VKYKTFRFLVIASVLLLGGGATALLVQRCEPSTPTVAASPAGPADPAGPAQLAPGAPSQPGDHPLRDLDRAILARVEKNIASAKEKDALRGQPYKVNLYRDAGQPGVNRLKIDLDRDDRDDEKWTFEPDGRVKRQVSPADDERYTVEYRLEGDRWRLKR